MVLKLFFATLLTCGIAVAQVPASSQSSCAAAGSVVFQSVSMHASSAATRSRVDEYSTDGFSIQGSSIRTLLQLAFLTTRMGDLPDWVSGERFDVATTLAEGDCCRWLRLGSEERARALQQILKDRLHLQWHFEMRPVPGVALAIAKGGPKLQAEQRPPICAACSYRGSILTMKELAESISVAIGRPVLDQTGLGGTYRVDWPGYDDFYRAPRIDVEDVIDAAGQPVMRDDGPSVSDQLKWFGLTLRSRAMVPVAFLIIDHIEPPSER